MKFLPKSCGGRMGVSTLYRGGYMKKVSVLLITIILWIMVAYVNAATNYCKDFSESGSYMQGEMQKFNNEITFEINKSVDMHTISKLEEGIDRELILMVKDIKYDFRYTDTTTVVNVKIQYKVTKQQYEKAVLEVQKDIARIRKSTKRMDVYQTIKYINRYALNHIEYRGGELKNTLVGAVNGEAVCGGISIYTKHLLEGVRIECGYVLGYLGSKEPGSYHMWNMVKANGKWYHVDVTANRLQDNWLLVPDVKMEVGERIEIIKSVDAACDAYYPERDSLLYGYKK
jgi:transglutaminase/protease-like cytokinesis protein 3